VWATLQPVPLPDDSKTAWPPKAWATILDDIAESAAWYAGDPKALAARYGKAPSRTERPRFWSRRDADGNTRQKLHVPAAADIATTSADLLFGETPTFTIPEAHVEKAPADAIAAQDRISELGETLGLANTLLEAAEVCSGLGGVYLRPGWNTDVADRPILDVVHADHAIPVWVYGILVKVTFWRTLTVDHGSSVWRHLECHEPGRITHGLFVGSKDALGLRRPLDNHPDTAGIDADDDGLVLLPESIRGLGVRYVPNALPNRKHRGVKVGRSDTAGVEDLMDALDETWTSWLRDIRIGQARIIVPNEFLTRRGRGSGAQFDADQEVFSPVEMDPTAEGAKTITPVEFEIRTREHAETAMALFEQILSPAGYDGQTFGLHGDGGSDKTATEVRAREGRTLRTTKKKQRYWGPEINDCLRMLLIIDREIFGRRDTPIEYRPRIDFDDGLVEDPHRTAETIELLTRAQAMSIETRVRMAQPNLDDAEIRAEVDRIRQDEGLFVDDPTGGLP